jgi:hypothetical protein
MPVVSSRKLPNFDHILKQINSTLFLFPGRYPMTIRNPYDMSLIFDSAMLILIEHQTDFLSFVPSMDVLTLKNNIIALGKIDKRF